MLCQVSWSFLVQSYGLSLWIDSEFHAWKSELCSSHSVFIFGRVGISNLFFFPVTRHPFLPSFSSMLYLNFTLFFENRYTNWVNHIAIAAWSSVWSGEDKDKALEIRFFFHWAKRRSRMYMNYNFFSPNTCHFRPHWGWSDRIRYSSSRWHSCLTRDKIPESTWLVGSRMRTTKITTEWR